MKRSPPSPFDPGRRSAVAGSAGLIATTALAPLHALAQAAAPVLTIAFTGEPASLDPHFTNGPGAHMHNRHVFERLTDWDAEGRLIPALATAWRAENPRTWVFTLRPGVKFHDGSELEAADVVASLERVPKINSGAFNSAVRGIAKAVARDRLTVAMQMDAPHPTLPQSLSVVSILPAKLAGAPSEDFVSGRAMVGTGPFRFKEYRRTQQYTLTRNDAYWGPKPDWAEARLRYIPEGAARIAALLSGEVDLIQNLPALEAEALAKNPRFRVFAAPSYRVYFMNFDLARPVSDFALGEDGKPLPKNPLLDVRVRQAIAGSIDSQLLVERVMGGFGEPVGQLASTKTFGHAPNLAVPRLAQAAARKLLADAGHPNGFALTIHAPTDSVAGAPGLAQGIASMLGRIGIRTTVATAPWAVFFREVMKEGGPAWSAWMMSWGNSGGDSMDALQALMHSRLPEKKLGAQNQSRYSNPAFDKLVQDALDELDDTKRSAMQQQAMKLLVDDVAVAPLFVQVSVDAGRAGLVHPQNPRGHIHAHDIRLAK
jgi:peptide/nickel transport system substrate-binding protein